MQYTGLNVCAQPKLLQGMNLCIKFGSSQTTAGSK